MGPFIHIAGAAEPASVYRLPISLLFAALAATALTPAHAQSQAIQTVPLPELVVSAHQVPLEISKVGTSVEVLQGDDLRARGFTTIADALRGVAGVGVTANGSRGSLTQLRIRGSEANHVLTLVDGVPVNRVDVGDFDYGGFGIEAVERIEILRGPQSGLYGANAHSGVVSIITKSGRGLAKPIVEAKAEAGKAHSNALAAGVRGSVGPFYGSMTFETMRTAGFNIARTGVERDGNNSRTATIRGGADLSPNVNIDGSFRYNNRAVQYDQEFFADPPVTDSPAYDTNRTSSGRVAATFKSFDGHWINRIGYSRLTDAYTSDFDFGPASIFRTRGDRDVKDYKSSVNFGSSLFGGEKHVVSALFDQEREKYFSNSGGGTPVNQSRKRNGIGGEYILDFMSGLTLSAALRRDDNEVYADATTYRLTANQRIDATQSRLHGSYGTGQTVPTFAEQFGQSVNFRGNPNLTPEHSRGWDAGVEQKLFGGRIVIDNTYFRIRAEDEIITAPLGGGLTTVVNNPGEAERHGLETIAKFYAFNWLTLSGGHTYLRATRSDSTPEPRRPEHVTFAQATLLFAEARGRFTFDWRKNGNFEDRPFLPPTGNPVRRAMPGYEVASATLSYEVFKGATAYVRGENVFSETYEEVYSYRSPGRAVYAGMRFRTPD